MKKNNKSPAVKICGLTDPEEAAHCAELGADAIGLVFYPKSPRAVSIKTAKVVCSCLPDHILTTGVFVNRTYDDIMETAEACSLKAVQLHGKESPALVTRLKNSGLFVIKALFAEKQPFLENADQYSTASALLVEYGRGVLPGGNAKAWNWERARGLPRDQMMILAGGLDPENIQNAIKAALPDAVDVSSGVESAPGKKDLLKVKTFIKNVRLG